MRKDGERNFWKEKAKTYPLPFDARHFPQVSENLAKLEKLGVSFRDKKLLDIGCGTGIYSLPLAGRGAEVFCLDFSRRMLSILAKEEKKHSLKVRKRFYSDWSGFDSRKYRKKFDLVFASMTAAVKTFNDLEKMEECAKEFCIVITWAGERKNRFTDGIYRLFGKKRKVPDFAAKVEKYLRKKRIPHKKRIIREVWEFEGTPAEAAAGMLPHLKNSGIKTDIPALTKILEPFAVKGILKHKTYAKKALFLWRPRGDADEH